MCLTHPWREVLERFLIELLELNTLNESTFRMNFCCVKSTFLFGTIIFDKVLKLVEGAIKPLQRKKTLERFNKMLEKYQWRNSLASILIFQVASQKPAVFFFTSVYKKFHKNFQRTSRWLLSNYNFFIQVAELNYKLDELSLKDWIRPWGMGWKEKIKLNFSGFLIILIQNILFLKEFLSCTSCFGLFAKIKRCLGLAFGAHLPHDFSITFFI